jgi:plastocyanin
MDHLYGNMAPMDATTKLAQKEGIAEVDGKKTGACDNIGENHKIYIKDGAVTPSHTEAQLCDSLSFINQDSVTHEMAFGAHPKHGLYGGESGPTVRSGRPETITLNQAGDYKFHDHANPTITGTFTVNP